jgi:predicted permease
MKIIRRLLSILDWRIRRDRAETRLGDDLQGFLDLAVADKLREGMTPEQARRAAWLELGGTEPMKELIRSTRHGHLLDELERDVRHGCRMFVRQPGFTAIVLLTLALGIGANTAVFSLIDALMLRSLPVSDPQSLRLVNLSGRNSLPGRRDSSLSYPIVRALDAQHEIFSGVAGFSGTTFNVDRTTEVTRIRGALVTGNFFRTLGVKPTVGRLLEAADDERGAPLTAVISDGFWAREFNRNPATIGQTLLLNGAPATVVGVTPKGFDGANVGQPADVTIAIASLPIVQPAMAGLLEPGNFWIRVLARPAAGVSAREAAARLNAAWPTLAESVLSPRWSASRRADMIALAFFLDPGATGWTFLRSLYDRPLVVLQVVAALVLVIACANIASLFLARASSRRREMAVRLAIGAGRARILRQLLIEGFLLTFAGAALGIGVAWASGRFLLDLLSTGAFTVAFDLTPNWHVLGFAVLFAVATGTVFGVAPAVSAMRQAPAMALVDDSRTSTRRSRALPALVALQVALSLVLVSGAALFARTLSNLHQVSSGFDADGVFVVDLERGNGPAPESLADIVRRVPGVTSASVTTHTPLNGSSWSEAIVPAGEPMPAQDNARIVGVGPQFFETLRIPLSRGRRFTADDIVGHPGVAIVNERYAAKYFPNRSPLGQRLVSTLMGQAADLEVVGVARDTAASNLRSEPPPMVYVAFDQFGGRQSSPSLTIRVNRSSAAVVAAVHEALQHELPGFPVEVRALAAQIDGTLMQERLMATLAGGFGVLALVLSSIGVYGLLAYTVALRSREIGIRMALGSTRVAVVSTIVRQGLWLLLLGVAAGYPAARAASGLVSSMLFGVTPSDPATMMAAAGVLTAAVLLASYLPARRASRVNPLVVLRHE